MTSTNPIDEYIERQDPARKDNLCAVRMPTWWKGHNLIHFAAAKKHIGIYPGPGAVEHFAHQFTKRGLKFSKGAVQIPYGENLPLDLIAEIAHWCGEHHSD